MNTHLFEGRCLALIHHRGFDHLPVTIERIKLQGNALRLRCVLCQQQPHTKARIADAPARIDPRPQEISQMPSLDRTGQTHRINQGPQPDALTLAHDLQTLPHKGTVQTTQRHHICNRGQRN